MEVKTASFSHCVLRTRSPQLNTESRNLMATFFCERQILGSDAHLSINLCNLARVLLKSSERGCFLRVQMKFPIRPPFHFLIPVGLFLSHSSFSSRHQCAGFDGCQRSMIRTQGWLKSRLKSWCDAAGGVLFHGSSSASMRVFISR